MWQRFLFKKMRNSEVWKPVPGYKKLYEVSNLGNIRGLKSKKILKPGLNNKGYCLVTLWNNNDHKTFTVHRIVASVFIPNKYNYPQVNHKDSCKSNNAAINLEWSTGRSNIMHSVINKTFKASRLKIG